MCADAIFYFLIFFNFFTSCVCERRGDATGTVTVIFLNFFYFIFFDSVFERRGDEVAKLLALLRHQRLPPPLPLPPLLRLVDGLRYEDTLVLGRTSPSSSRSH